MLRRYFALCTFAALVACRAPRPQGPPPTPHVATAAPPTPPLTAEACTARLEKATGDDQELEQLGNCPSLIANAHYVSGVPALVGLVRRAMTELSALASLALRAMPDEAEPVILGAIDERSPDDTPFSLVHTLANISRPAGKSAILRMLDRPMKDETRDRLVVALTVYPHDDKTTKALISNYAKLAPDSGYRLELLQAASEFFDPSLVSWLLGAYHRNNKYERLAALHSAILLMTKAQVPAVEKAVDDDDAFFESSRGALDRCGKDAHCYVQILGTPPRTSAASKAAWMAAMFGNRTTRAELVELVPQSLDAGTRGLMLTAIDKLAPQGDFAAAARFDEIREQQRALEVTLLTNRALRDTALVLRSRATAP